MCTGPLIHQVKRLDSQWQLDYLHRTVCQWQMKWYIGHTSTYICIKSLVVIEFCHGILERVTKLVFAWSPTFFVVILLRHNGWIDLNEIWFRDTFQSVLITHRIPFVLLLYSRGIFFCGESRWQQLVIKISEHFSQWLHCDFFSLLAHLSYFGYSLVPSMI